LTRPRPKSPGLASRASLKRFAYLSIAAALVTMGLKGVAYLMTDSVGLLSDALESLVNLAGAMMALAMLTVAARPEDEDHPHGHGKAEYFSSGVEGTLILLAAVSIGWAAIARLLHPKPLEQVGVGLVVAIAASVLNLVVALVLLRTGRREQSITLEANAHHLLTDVSTSVGVVVGVGATALTGWQPLDSIVALLVALNIVWTGTSIVRESVHGLMDRAVAPGEQMALLAVLDRYRTNGVDFHALRTRQAGARRFVSVHVLVPGAWTVHDGHVLLEKIEADVRTAVPNVSVLTHLESVEDPASWADVGLDRPAGS
jgi:cation diffusion facilitator family transporter